MEKSFGVSLELKDLDTSKRTAIIRHAVYGSIDRNGDISHKGMFSKSWKENKTSDVGFLFNHQPGAKVGSVKSLTEDDAGAYSHVTFGNWTLGNDVLEMASEGVLEGASFGFETKKKDFSTVKSRKIRNLREVYHGETSLLTISPAHPEAGIVMLTKSFAELELKSLSDGEQTFLKSLMINDQASIEALVALMATVQPESDLYTWVAYQLSSRVDRVGSIMSQLKWNVEQIRGMKSYVENVEKYCHKANASDDTIISLQTSLVEYKQIISEYDTEATRIANEQGSSDEGIAQMLLKMRIALTV